MEFELEIPKKQFKEHLGIANNNRIIFSGAFGTGKTYFLEKFFKDHESFEAIHLFPVNYSVASNEDIFELIKYDILFKLLEEGLNFEEVKIDKGTFLPFFLENHSIEIIPFLLGVIPKVGGSLKEIAQGLIDLDKKFNKEFKEANLTDQDRIISYLAEFPKKQGSVNEEDFYTQLICSLVNQLKEKGKEIVLIIDDLDRIDPEHIFRILNVLAAHVDVKKDSEQNKFDFGRIILVCDIENIRKIFSNRYGSDVDFSGYIDKFYSKSVFHFDLSGELEKKLTEVFNKILIQTEKETYDLNKHKSQDDIMCIHYIIFSLIDSNILSIRNILKLLNKEIKFKGITYTKVNGRYLDLYDFRLLKILRILDELFNDRTEFLNSLYKIKETKNNNIYIENKDLFFNLLLPFLTYEKHKWEISEEEDGTLQFDDLIIEWKLTKLNSDPSGRNIYFNPEYKILKNGVLMRANEINFFFFLKKTIEVIDQYNLNWYK
jgi:hypothetical protein|tara:strand:+ start:20903 stop:22366 length:1464 start_codon:yes stop_codon:yes gene_type:complete